MADRRKGKGVARHVILYTLNEFLSSVPDKLVALLRNSVMEGEIPSYVSEHTLLHSDNSPVPGGEIHELCERIGRVVVDILAE